MEWIDEAKKAGAGILTGGRREGSVVAPTLVELSEPKLHRLRVWCEEVFGPVATVEPINSFAEAIAATNDSPYGLQAGVFTPKLEHAFMAFREIEAVTGTGGAHCAYLGDNPRKDFTAPRRLGWRTARVRRAEGEHASVAGSGGAEFNDLLG